MRMSSLTSLGSRFQFSVEKHQTVRVPILGFFRHQSVMVRKFSIAVSWPFQGFKLRALAQRRLPSGIMAMWLGRFIEKLHHDSRIFEVWQLCTMHFKWKIFYGFVNTDVISLSWRPLTFVIGMKPCFFGSNPYVAGPIINKSPEFITRFNS